MGESTEPVLTEKEMILTEKEMIERVVVPLKLFQSVLKESAGKLFVRENYYQTRAKSNSTSPSYPKERVQTLKDLKEHIDHLEEILQETESTLNDSYDRYNADLTRLSNTYQEVNKSLQQLYVPQVPEKRPSNVGKDYFQVLWDIREGEEGILRALAEGEKDNFLNAYTTLQEGLKREKDVVKGYFPIPGFLRPSDAPTTSSGGSRRRRTKQAKSKGKGKRKVTRNRIKRRRG